MQEALEGFIDEIGSFSAADAHVAVADRDEDLAVVESHALVLEQDLFATSDVKVFCVGKIKSPTLSQRTRKDGAPTVSRGRGRPRQT